MDSDPRHARLPLPGGRAGATVHLHALACGERRPRNRLGRGMGEWAAITAFLLVHPAAGPVLVDCGLHPSVAHDPAQNLGRSARRLELRMERDQALDEHLRRRDLSPEGIRTVLMTHLHPEQASGVSEFPNATFLLDAREWAAASSGAPGYHPRHVDYPFDWRTVDFASDAIDAFATFGRAADVFGDGSVRLVSTPGHSPGHQSVLVRTAGGREVLICGDAVTGRAELDGADPAEKPADEHLHRRSLSEIRRFAEQTPSAVLAYGHEPPATATS